MTAPTGLKLTYTDRSHSYYLNGKRARGVTTVAKIPADSYNIEQWAQRQVAIGLTIDRNLIENVAVDIENREAIQQACEDAKRVAKAHQAADRGTQMHRVLELVLLDQEAKLLTEQQRRDADVLKRTLDRYKLTPHDGLTEQFVAWPHYTVCGRFDAVLEKSNGDLILTDLKSGPNAVAYPHSTAVQLALYARAPHISSNIQGRGEKCTVTEWRTMPQKLDRRRAYVLLVEPDSDEGTLHELDIEHGWAGAQHALRIVKWRKGLDYGKGIATEVDAELFTGSRLITRESVTQPSGRSTFRGWTRRKREIELAFTELGCARRAAQAETLDELRQAWNHAKKHGALTEDFRAFCTERSRELAATTNKLKETNHT